MSYAQSLFWSHCNTILHHSDLQEIKKRTTEVMRKKHIAPTVAKQFIIYQVQIQLIIE